jgi:tetratricopeptide (TPR) repeat protein
VIKYIIPIVILAISITSAVAQDKTNAAAASSSITNQDDAIEKEYQKLLDEDDEAQAEMDDWIKQTNDQSTNSFSASQITLKLKIHQRIEQVKNGYEAFLKKYPNHTKAMIAYASFLSDIGKEEESFQQLETAKQKDPKNPAVWNNLANYYGHNDSTTNAFYHYEKAIELNPNEPVYYKNFATTIYMFRDESMEYYKLSEEQVIEKAAGLYKKALQLNPKDFHTASDLAQTYYGYKLPQVSAKELRNNKQIQQIADKAIDAWKIAEKLARDDVEKQGIKIHIARWQISSGRLSEAKNTLESVKLDMYETNKESLDKKIQSMESELSEAKNQ